MDHPLRDALRERFAPRSILYGAVLLAAFHVLLDASFEQLATMAAFGAVTGLTGAARDAYDLREPVEHAGLGAIAVVGGVGLLAAGEGATWLPAAFLAVGCWFLLDAVQTVRHEGATEDVPDGHEVYHDYVARQVHDLLADRPRTRRELGDELDADDEALDAAVEKLLTRGVVTRAGSELRVASSDREGWWARTRDRLAGVVGRIARPLALEFGRESEADGDDARPASDRRGPAGDGTGPGRSAPSDEDADSEPETAGRR